MITKDQIKKIKTLIKLAGFSDENYRSILVTNFNVRSCTKLTHTQAEYFIDWLQRNTNVKDKVGKTRFESLANRGYMATPAQLRKIEAMWKDVCHFKTEEGRKASLRKFLEKKCNVSDLKFLPKNQVTKVIAILDSMKQQQMKGETYGKS